MFYYIEITDGGADGFEVKSKDDLKGLYGWMSEGCEEDDTAMLAWMDTANDGDIYLHRLGWLVKGEVKNEA